MRKKLLVSALSMIVIILLIVAGNQIIIRLFANFSNKLIVEYHELHSLQELKVALSKTMTYLHMSDTIHGAEIHPDFEAGLTESFAKMHDCRKVISDIHKGKPWEDTKSLVNNLYRFEKQWKVRAESTENLAAIIFLTITQIIENIDLMVQETLEEIEEFEHRNDTVVKHGSATILVFGIALIVFLAIGGLRFIRNLTRPIDQLVLGMKKIAAGETNVKVEVKSNDEFEFLADSFNSMIETLNSTTISKVFFSNILNNLYGALVVTDKNGLISFINDTACRLLKCDNTNLLGTASISLFNDASVKDLEGLEQFDIDHYAAKLRKMTEMKTLDEQLIPVYVTCTILKNKQNEITGMVVVAHDLTVEKAHEEKMERVRKDRLIAINEAEENERIRIARDLHDGLGQILTGISYSIQNLEPHTQEEGAAIIKIQAGITSAIQEAKNIAHNLTPVILKDFGLVAALENLVAKTNQVSKTKFTFLAYNFERRIDSRLEKALFRICQECIHNIIKHAEAETSTIQLFLDAGMIVLVIEDDGKGFAVDEIQKDPSLGGIGLISMKERAYVFDGVLSIDSTPSKGTEVMVEIPCPENRMIDE